MEKEFNPLISIVIPVYNGANFISEAIDSALAQTYKNIEILVVDDGSSDNTGEIVKRYGSAVKYFPKENGGVSTALNFGIENAKGEYLSWLSHDDFYHSDKIEKQIKILAGLSEEERKSTVLYSSFEEMNEDKNVYDKFEPQKKYSIKKLNNSFWPVIAGLINGCTVLFPKSCFEQIGNFNPELRYTQDSDFFFRLYPKFKLLFHPDITVISRKHKEQGGQLKNERIVKEDNDLYINMVNKINVEQRIEISGSEIGFLKEVLDIVYGLKYIYAAKYIEEKIKKIEIEKQVVSMNKFKKMLVKLYSKLPMSKQLLGVQKRQSEINKKLDFILERLQNPPK